MLYHRRSFLAEGYNLNSASERELCSPPKPQPLSSTTGRCLAKAGIAAGIASDKPAQARHKYASAGTANAKPPVVLRKAPLPRVIVASG